MIARNRNMQISAKVGSYDSLKKGGPMMNVKKVVVVAGMSIMILVISAVGVVNAQPDLSIWEGRWFKVTINVKGVAYDGFELINFREKIVGYWKVFQWDAGAEELEVDVYEYDGESLQWERIIIFLHFHAGSPLDFVCWFLQQDVFKTDAFTGRITGREKGGILSSATFKGLGGCSWEIDDVQGSDERWTVGASLKGKMIPAEKVPVPSGLIVR